MLNEIHAHSLSACLSGERGSFRRKFLASFVKDIYVEDVRHCYSNLLQVAALTDTGDHKAVQSRLMDWYTAEIILLLFFFSYSTGEKKFDMCLASSHFFLYYLSDKFLLCLFSGCPIVSQLYRKHLLYKPFYFLFIQSSALYVCF